MVRLICISKGLLKPGQSLHEAVVDRLEGDLTTTAAKILPDSPLGSISNEAPALPTLPTAELDDDDVANMSAIFAYAALQAGYEQDDPVLFWLSPKLIRDMLPTLNGLLLFEQRMIAKVGKRLIDRGRLAAFNLLCRHLGDPSVYERRDWHALPMAYIRDFTVAETEDERSLMISRLEKVAQKASSALDLRTELQALRTLAAVKGLTTQDDTKQQRELIKLFQKPVERSPQLAAPRNSDVIKRLTGNG